MENFKTGYWQMVKFLVDNGFKSVKLYENREVFEKNGKHLTIPVTCGTVSGQLVRKLKEKAKYY